MYDISIIITINKNEKNIKELLNLVNNQKLFSIELIFTYSKFTTIHGRILKKIASRLKNVKLIQNNSLTYFNLLKKKKLLISLRKN